MATPLPLNGNSLSPNHDTELGLLSPTPSFQAASISNSNIPEKLTHITQTSLDSIVTGLGGPLPLKRSFARWLWPPRGLPQGLYHTALTSMCKNQYKFYIASTIYNTCLILQLILGAVLTALGASSAGANHTAITILAAANTVNAGLCALLHNSGLPGRIRNDYVEYERVVMWLEEVMRGGIAVGVGLDKGTAEAGRDEVVREGWARYQRARATVEKNRPGAYMATNGTTSPGTTTPIAAPPPGAGTLA